jgi:hypothetical protein
MSNYRQNDLGFWRNIYKGEKRMADSDSSISGCTPNTECNFDSKSSSANGSGPPIQNDIRAFNKVMAKEHPSGNQGSYGRVNTQKSIQRDTFHTGHISDLYDNDHQHTEDSGMLPCPKKPPDKNDKNWRSYDETGNPAVFHCGYKGFLEAREKPPGTLTNECFYDEMDNLVDENHPNAACGGTPDEYPPDSLVNKVQHIFIDKGGIVRSGGPAFIESRKVELEKLKEEIIYEINGFENRIKNRFLPCDFRR